MSCARLQDQTSQRGCHPAPQGGAVQCYPELSALIHPAGHLYGFQHKHLSWNFRCISISPLEGQRRLPAMWPALSSHPASLQSQWGWRLQTENPQWENRFCACLPPPSAVGLASGPGFPRRVSPHSPEPTRASPGGQKGRAWREAVGGSKSGSGHLLAQW